MDWLRGFAPWLALTLWAAPPLDPPMKNARIAFLHHSTGGNVWAGGVEPAIKAWNESHSTNHQITEIPYPASTGGHSTLAALLPMRAVHALVAHYPWSNYPYDYWNLWVAHAGGNRVLGERTLEELAAAYDVIVFKHCYPVSGILPDDGHPDVASPRKTLANYKLQYEALRARLRQFPRTRFILWTAPALTKEATTPDQAQRAQDFVLWVKNTWDQPGDNIHLWDFRAIETDGGLYLKPEFATSTQDPHPNPALCRKAAPLLAQRILEVVEGRSGN